MITLIERATGQALGNPGAWPVASSEKRTPTLRFVHRATGEELGRAVREDAPIPSLRPDAGAEIGANIGRLDRAAEVWNAANEFQRQMASVGPEAGAQIGRLDRAAEIYNDARAFERQLPSIGTNASGQIGQLDTTGNYLEQANRQKAISDFQAALDDARKRRAAAYAAEMMQGITDAEMDEAAAKRTEADLAQKRADQLRGNADKALQSFGYDPKLWHQQNGETDILKLILGGAHQGLNAAGEGIASSLDFLARQYYQGLLGWTPEEYDNSDAVFHSLHRRAAAENQAWRNYYAPNESTPGAQFASRTIQGVAQALPAAIIAMMSGGAGLGTTAAASTAGLEAASSAAGLNGAAAVANTARTATAAMLQNPQYWMTVLDKIGTSYENAKADGADEDRATTYAVLNALLNAMVEIGGGGIQELPEQLQNGSCEAVRQWVDTMLDEGKEEIVQGVIERGLEIIYGKENLVVSLSDPNAVFNPYTMAQEGAMGALVGGILGGGEIGVDAILQNAARVQADPAEVQRYYEALGLEMPAARNALASPAQAGYNDSVDRLIDAFINGNLEGGPGNGIFQGTDREDAAGNAGAQATAGDRSGVQEGNRGISRDDGQSRDAAGEGYGRLTVAEETAQTLREHNIITHIVSNENWSHPQDAFTRNGEVYLRSDIPEIFRGMVAAHEITHAMKQLGYRPYLDFMERTPEILDPSNSNSRKLLQAIADDRGIDPLTANSKELFRLYDELNATVYGHIASGKIDEAMDAGLRSAFYDFDAYAAELRSIHEQFRRSRSPGQVQQNTQRAEGTAQSPFGALRSAHSDSGSIDPLSSLLASYRGNPSPTAEDDYELLSVALPKPDMDFFSALELDLPYQSEKTDDFSSRNQYNNFQELLIHSNRHNVSDIPTFHLSKKEYRHIMSDLSTWVDPDDCPLGTMQFFTTFFEDNAYTYAFERIGDSEFRIIGKTIAREREH